MHVTATTIRSAAAVVLSLSIVSAAFGAESDLRMGLQLYEERKWSSAYKILRPLADAGEPEAQLIVGEMLLLGRGTAQDERAGLAMLSAARATDGGAAHYVLGKYFVDQRNGARALPELLAAAEAGHVPAMVLLGRVHGGGYGVARAPKDSLRWYLRAVDGGSADVDVAFVVGMALLEGRDLPRGPSRGAALLERAGHAGHLRAQAELGLLYTEGKVVAMDLPKAERWLRQSAAKHFALGELRLGDVFSRLGDPGRALECYGAALLDARADGDEQTLKVAVSRLTPFAIAGHIGVKLEKPNGPCEFEPVDLLKALGTDYFRGR